MLPKRDGFAVCRDDPRVGLRRADPDADRARRGGGAHRGTRLRRRRLPREAVRFRRAARAAARAGPPRPPAAAARAADGRSARDRHAQPAACASATREVPLTAKEYALLEYLVRRAGDVVSRADIAEHVWDEHYDPLSNVVDVYVQRLRRKLDRSGSDSLIRTRRGEGYQLVTGTDRAMTTLSLRARLTLWYTLALLVVLVPVRRQRAVAAAADRLPPRRPRARRAARATLEQRRSGRAQRAGRSRDRGGRGDGHGHGAGPGARDPRRAAAACWPRSWNGLELRELAARRQRRMPRVWTVETQRRRRGAVHARRARVRRDRRSVLIVGEPARRTCCASSAKCRKRCSSASRSCCCSRPPAGCWLASIGLRPDHRHGAARGADSAERAWRISDRPTRTDELGQLATAFNGLVARLRAALQTQRQFMADASHELRTPVSVVRATADVMLSRDHRDEAEYREALAIVGGQARRLGRLVEDMLVLARADAGGYPLQPVDLYLDEVVAECRRAVDVLATERGVTIRSAARAGHSVPRRRGSAAPARAERAAERGSAHADRRLGRGGHPPGTGGGADPRDRRGPGIPADDQGADLRSLRAARCGAPRAGRRARPADRAMDRGSASAARSSSSSSGPGGSTFCVSLPNAVT